MRQILSWWFALSLFASAAWSAEFNLLSGEKFVGEIASATEQGVVFRLAEGGFSQRVDYARFSEESLKAIGEDPRAKKFVAPLLAPPPEEKVLQEAKQITVKQPARLERPSVKAGLFSALTTPNGLILLGLLFAANLFAAYHVARFRQQSVPLVCGISAILPLVGPIAFLAMHPAQEHHAEMESVAAPETPGVPMAANTAESRVGALGMSKSGGGGQSEGVPRSFKRGETTFNRRFFETQFPTFFRVVASDADRDLVLDINAGKNSIIATRISRISANEAHFKTTAGTETSVDFGEINSITLRHKDGKA